jgi:DNA sulfur modification protein DndB
MQIPDTIAVKQLSDVPAMVAAALQYAYGNRATLFEGTLFEQGGRVMFSTAMLFENFVRVAAVKSSAKKEADVQAVAESTNRPIDKNHVRAITKYLIGAVKSHDKYIMPPATLNLRGGKGAALFTITGESSIKTAILTLPSYARFDITDAQHRREGIEQAMADRDPSIRDQLLHDSIAVMITFEENPDQVHQDFADASKTRAIADSLVAVYDNRLPVNALAVHLARSCGLFKHTIDATAKGSNLSAGSVKVWNTSALRQFVKYAGLNSRAGDDAWNKAFVDNYGEPDAYQRFRNYLVEFVQGCTEYIPLFRKLSTLNADDLSEVPRIRAQDGGQVLMTAAGMNVLGGVCYSVYQRYKLGEDIFPYLKRLGDIEWSYEGALWKNELVNEEIGKTASGATVKVLRVSANAVHVRGAISKVLEAIGLRILDKAA